jgi:hypothetical protein
LRRSRFARQDASPRTVGADRLPRSVSGARSRAGVAPQTVMTTLPRARPSLRYRMASGTSLSGNVLSTTGVILPVAEQLLERRLGGSHDSSLAEPGEEQLTLAPRLRERVGDERPHDSAPVALEAGDEAPVGLIEARNGSAARRPCALPLHIVLLVRSGSQAGPTQRARAAGWSGSHYSSPVARLTNAARSSRWRRRRLPTADERRRPRAIARSTVRSDTPRYGAPSRTDSNGDEVGSAWVRSRTFSAARSAIASTKSRERRETRPSLGLRRPH